MKVDSKIVLKAKCPKCGIGEFGYDVSVMQSWVETCEQCYTDYSITLKSNNSDGNYTLWEILSNISRFHLDFEEINDPNKMTAWLVIRIPSLTKSDIYGISKIKIAHDEKIMSFDETVFRTLAPAIEKEISYTQMFPLWRLIEENDLKPTGAIELVGCVPIENPKETLKNIDLMAIKNKAEEQYCRYYKVPMPKDEPIVSETFEEIFEEDGPWENGKDLIIDILSEYKGKSLEVTYVEFTKDLDLTGTASEFFIPKNIYLLPEDKQEILMTCFCSVLDTYKEEPARIFRMYQNNPVNNNVINLINLHLKAMEEKEIFEGGDSFHDRLTQACGLKVDRGE